MPSRAEVREKRERDAILEDAMKNFKGMDSLPRRIDSGGQVTSEFGRDKKYAYPWMKPRNYDDTEVPPRILAEWEFNRGRF